QLLDDLKRVALALGVTRLVGHDHGQDVVRPERLRSERGDQAGVDAAAQAEDDSLEPDLAHLVADEAHEDAADQLGIDPQRRKGGLRKAYGCAHAGPGEVRAWSDGATRRPGSDWQDARSGRPPD